MVIRKCLPLLAPLLALAGLLTVGGVGPVLADARPAIVSITLDANNHAVVTWSKEPWQGSLDVWWSSGDGAVASPDPGWNTHYGLPLVDCWGGQPNGQTTGAGPNDTWLFGASCQGQDVADEATSTTTNVVLAPGTYFFQVIVAGENAATGAKCSYQDKGLPTECLSPHYSDTYRVTVRLSAAGQAPQPRARAGSPRPSQHSASRRPVRPARPGRTRARDEIDGPGGLDLPQGGGHVDAAQGGQATFNPPFNLDVEFGEIHFSEDLAVFHCPAWTEPYSSRDDARQLGRGALPNGHDS